MALSLHVNGEARIMTGTGSADALQTLGVSRDGVTIEFKQNEADVEVDTFGGQGGTAFDVQYFLEEAMIEADLVWYDGTVLNNNIQRLNGASAPVIAGVMGSAGSLFIQNGYYTRVLVMSIPNGVGVTNLEPCHNFPYSYLQKSHSNKFGTKYNQWKVTFRALPVLSSTSGGPSTGAKLYDTVCT